MLEKRSVICVDVKDLKFKKYREGLRGCILCDENTPSDSLYSGYMILEPGTKIGLHWHDIEELQYILYGSGLVRDREGNEYEARPGTVLYCPSGIEGAHAFENTSELPMIMLYVYPSPGGGKPLINYIEK